MLRRSITLLVTLLVGACAGSDEGSVSSDVMESRCEARFRYWQKDAYRDTAGRDFEFWPVHTTTEIEVSCGEEVIARRSMANHGTDVGQVDDQGAVILVEAREPSVATAPRSELLALVDAYSECSCDQATTFLSLDSLNDTLAHDLVLEFERYLRDNLICADGVDSQLEKLIGGDVEEALAALQSCTWTNGSSLLAGLEAAAAELARAANRQLDDYHVCNNDAELQSDLFERFLSSGVVSPCDASSELCRRPTWFYDP